MVTIDLEGAEQANRQLLRLQQRVGNLSPVLADIGEHMVNSTHDNFETSTAPDGTPWASNSPATFASMLGKSHHRKDGRINKRGANKVMSKSPLIQSRTLMQSTHYQVNGQAVEIGTNMVYGAMMHFGGSKSAYPNLWGDIPARPYLGLKAGDKPILLQMVGQYLIR